MHRRLLTLLLLAVSAARSQEAIKPDVVSLDQALQEALGHNLDLIAARYSVSVAEARRITAALRPNPVVSISAEHLDLLGTGFSAANSAGPSEYSYRTDFVLERGGKRAGRIAVAENERSIAQLGVLNTARTLILDIENAFVEVQAAKESLTLAQDNLNALNGIVNVNALRVRTGDLAQVELVRSRVAALQFQTAVEQGRLRLQQAKVRLQTLMGRLIPTDAFDVSPSIRRDGSIPTYESLLAVAAQRRPDLLALQQTQARSQADLRLQIAQGKIDYTVGSEYRRQQGLAGTGNMLGFFFSAPLPVFNRNQGEIERARRELEQAGARIRALELTLRSEMMTAYEQSLSSRGLLENIETNMVEQARQVRKTMEYSYRRGEASLIEFLDAQRAFNDAMLSYNEARANYARSLYLLDSITGTNLPANVTP
jgi:cobalt-zinc-cadmium efflux system outer membrane protein